MFPGIFLCHLSMCVSLLQLWIYSVNNCRWEAHFRPKELFIQSFILSISARVVLLKSFCVRLPGMFFPLQLFRAFYQHKPCFAFLSFYFLSDRPQTHYAQPFLFYSGFSNWTGHRNTTSSGLIAHIQIPWIMDSQWKYPIWFMCVQRAR